MDISHLPLYAWHSTMRRCKCTRLHTPPEELKMTFGEYLSKHGKTQLRLAETQKYAHVYFLLLTVEKKHSFEGEGSYPCKFSKGSDI